MQDPKDADSAGDPNRFMPNDSGYPPLHLMDHLDSGNAPNLRPCENGTGLLIGPTDRRLFRGGVYSYDLRGGPTTATRAGRVNSTRGNRSDSSDNMTTTTTPTRWRSTADEDGATVAGYLSEGHAKRLATLLDAGVELRAVNTRGAGRG